MHVAAAVGSLVGAAGVLAWRVRESRRAVTAMSILMPPLGMATGMFMFVVPRTRVPWTMGLAAFIAGVLLFSYPLIRTSKLELDGNVVMMRRSKAFLWILLGLVAARLALRTYVEQFISLEQTAALFYLLAFGMIVTWRAVMYRRFLELTKPAPAKASTAR